MIMDPEKFRILTSEGASVPTITRYVLGQHVRPGVAKRLEETAARLGVTIPRIAQLGASQE